MHELSIAQAIADTTVRHAAGRPVAAVHVRIGHFRQVVPDSLQFAWELLIDGTQLHGAVLDIEHVPALLHCDDCDHDTLLDLPVLVCDTCGSTHGRLVAGDEFSIAAVDVVEVA